MRPYLFALPVALLLLGAVVAQALGARDRPARAVAAASAGAALVVLCVTWGLAPHAADVGGVNLGAGLRFALRIDALSFAFGVAVLVPAVLLLAAGHPTRSGLELVAIALGLLAVDAGSFGLAALAWSAAITVVALSSLIEGVEVPFAPRLRGDVTWICIASVAAVLLVRAGTDAYSAIPNGALDLPLAGLVALAALLATGVVPWRPWTALYHLRLRPVTAAIAAISVGPPGLLLLFRAVSAAGDAPGMRHLATLLCVLGAVAILASAWRAQAAATRREYLAEVHCAVMGLAVIGLALGSPTGAVMAVMATTVAGLALAAAALLPETGSAGTTVLVFLVAAGVPPTAVFATRLLAVEATIEAGGSRAFLAVLLAGAWVVALAAAARAARLPAGGAEPGSPVGAMVAGGLLLALGAGAGAFTQLVALPAASIGEVTGPVPGGGYFAVSIAVGSWPAATLGLLAAVAAAAWLKFGRGGELRADPASPIPAPLLAWSWGGRLRSALAARRGWRLADEWRVTDWATVQRGLLASNPWAWLLISTAVVASAIAASR